MNELERLAGGVIVCGFKGVDAPPEIRAWLRNRLVAGLILFKRNIENVYQSAELIASCCALGAPSPEILVCVDQEGGRVARFGDPLIELPPMQKLARAEDPDLTRLAASALGRQLRAVGVNLDLAPVLDVDTNRENPVIGDRAFGATVDRVIEHAFAFAEGLHAGGVLSCGKHFPGHGDTDLDSHLALPRLRHGRERLERVELAPFRAAVGRLPSLMTAHVLFEALDSRPATISPRVVESLLRKEIGYEGAVFTDDLEMKAVLDLYPVEESGVLAIEAGCDALLVCSDVDAVSRLRQALVRKAEQSSTFRYRLTRARERVDTLRSRVVELPPPRPLDDTLHHKEIDMLRARLRGLR